MKIALYKSSDGNISVNEALQWIEDHASYTRVTEIIEADFPALDSSETVRAELKMIYNDLASTQSRISHIESRKAKLEALV